ncbi:MAG: glycosyltransferase [Saprospiraceae bacterium]|nr:glycosyltransferase [Saprospiraceae bacterium]HMW38030.1 glycosyltransferase [Saprospiraceae bacterium]HMX86992.1 glycosyltransferase [Saprospiraceae bacterium]HMZ39829.1 glycosyltransferase [Saprospiraceae bacterium]HNA64310.1 glycosyltransferase [Saprospiraceae bacterium]
MLSILVPVYNQEIVALAATLVDACKKAEVRYEILFGEDGSSAEWVDTNSTVKNLDSVEHLVFKDNRGRSAIRNTLASLAKYECLLFLDADSQLTGSRFIADYLKLIKDYPVISGGRIYAVDPPEDKLLRLHWTYGTSKESKPAKARNTQPYLSFHSNNFVVRKDLMLAFPFDEEIRDYGYEDTVWALSLQRSGIMIAHIDNPCIHMGLEKAEVFVSKADSALRNLYHLEQKGLLSGLAIQRIARRISTFLPQTVRPFVKHIKIQLRSLLSNGVSCISIFQIYRLLAYYLLITEDESL